ncbi:MAG: PilT/PilU family type 4a pilus ATPase [Planctomycetes bacterium]|nr:PilT/PilU family type 4a pilus ATPase [Planctomycetota bacterium]
MAWQLISILGEARQRGASDVHLVRGIPPAMRLAGKLERMIGDPLDDATLVRFLDEVATPDQVLRFESGRELCVALDQPGIGRVRVSVYRRSGTPEMAIRLSETAIRPAADLRLPPIVEELTHRTSGLVLVTGPTGVGKTTTLNYMIDCINRQRPLKIVTIEDPIEYVHQSQRSIVVQQELVSDVTSFRSALVHVLRQDPDVIVIGEMRDLETIETALIAAETGHLVLATLHTPDVVQTVQRICSVFPSERQNAIILQLSNSLQAVVAQRLLPRANGLGQVLACEVCVTTPAVRTHIRERQVHQLANEMQTGMKLQMQTMDASLLGLYQQGEITLETALSQSRSADFIRRHAKP